MGASMTAGQLLRDRAVALLISVELLVNVAQGAVVTALGWQAYARAHQPIVLGLLGLAEFVPAVLLALPAGHIADRYDRRWVGGLGLGANVVVALALAADAATGDHAVWPLYVLAALMGATFSLGNPAIDPLLAAAVPPQSLARTIALGTSAGQLANIVGPALGGLTQELGAPAPYLLGAVSVAASTVALFAVPRSVGRAHVGDVSEDATLADALGGLRFIFATPPLLGAISLDLMAVLFGGVTALLPIFSSTILHVGAAGNGILRAAPGMGALVVGAVLAARPLRRRAGPVLFTVVAIYGAATVAFGVSRSFALSMLALAVLAGADMVSMLLRGTIGPLFTPPVLRGRVRAVERVFIGASNELGAFESGVAAALIGAVGAAVIGGAVSIAVAAIWAWRFPSLRRLDRLEDIRPGSLDDPPGPVLPAPGGP